MIYVLLTYLFFPLLYLIISLKKKNRFKKILVIQTAKIGDMICSTPVFREIKKKYPTANLSVIANLTTTELLKYNPHVDKIITLNTKDIKGISGKIKLIKLLYKGKYDVSLSLNPNIPFTIAPLWALIPIRIAIIPNFCGLTLKIASGLNTHCVRHETGRLVLETYMKMLEFLDIHTDNISKEVYKSPNADRKVLGLLSSKLKTQNSKLIGIAVSSGNKLKKLEVKTMAFLINELINDLNLSIVLIGSEADKNIAQEILDMSTKKNAVIDSTGVFSLSELPALIERLSLFIGVDTGITYMADALSVPLIDIAGPSDMSDQRPLGEKSIIIQKDISCVPCSHAFNAPYTCKRGDRTCITSVNVSEILQEVKRLLSPATISREEQIL
jgi:lipopolysaccharide heptosyltransferase II